MPKNNKGSVSIPELQQKLLKAHFSGKTWAEIGADYGCSGGLIHRIVYQDYEPKEPHIRFRMGLSSMLPAPVCPRCGIVHVTKRCPVRRVPLINWRYLFGMSCEELEQRLQCIAS
jgi:hypothetical protein